MAQAFRFCGKIRSRAAIDNTDSGNEQRPSAKSVPVGGTIYRHHEFFAYRISERRREISSRICPTQVGLAPLTASAIALATARGGDRSAFAHPRREKPLAR